MAKLRYDLAAESIITLQRYMDTCADDRNTIALLNNVEKAVGKLLKIEERVCQRHEAGASYGSDIVSAMAEIDNKVALTQGSVAQIQEFLMNYGNEILMLRDVLAKFQELAVITTRMKAIEKQLEGVRSRTSIF